jgi:hypothetical protein
MPKVVLERNGLKIDTDLSVADIRELMGLPAVAVDTSAPKNGQHPDANPNANGAMSADPSVRFKQFLTQVKDRARTFFYELSTHPQGIEANDLAKRLGFTQPNQIGGLIAGGDLQLRAKESGFRLRPDLYYKKITRPNGNRTLTYYPGKELLKMENPHD